MKQEFEIVKYSDEYRSHVLEVWEKSVLATHTFLSTEDFQKIKAIVQTIDFNAFEVYCLMRRDGVAGFLGVAERKIEMLFLSPDVIGKGLGKKLMEFALSELNVIKVDVNEQNENATKFYRKFGFKTYERTDKDDQGNDYPLLRMEIEV